MLKSVWQAKITCIQTIEKNPFGGYHFGDKHNFNIATFSSSIVIELILRGEVFDLLFRGHVGKEIRNIIGIVQESQCGELLILRATVSKSGGL